MKELFAGYASLGTLEKMYTVSLIVGIIVPLLDLIFGVLSLGLHMGLDIDFSMDADMSFASTWLPINTLAILSFLVLFGGGGLISLYFVDKRRSIIIAVAVGYFFAVAMNKFVILPLRKNRVTAPRAVQIIGRSARVTSPIITSGFGEIVLVIDRVTLSYAAKARDGEEIGYGEGVRVIELKENGVAIVEKELKEEI